MRRNEVIVKIVDALHIEYGENVDVNKVKEIIESIIYNYKSHKKECRRCNYYGYKNLYCKF